MGPLHQTITMVRKQQTRKKHIREIEDVCHVRGIVPLISRSRKSDLVEEHIGSKSTSNQGEQRMRSRRTAHAIARDARVTFWPLPLTERILGTKSSATSAHKQLVADMCSASWIYTHASRP